MKLQEFEVVNTAEICKQKDAGSNAPVCMMETQIFSITEPK